MDLINLGNESIQPASAGIYFHLGIEFCKNPEFLAIFHLNNDYYIPRHVVVRFAEKFKPLIEQRINGNLCAVLNELFNKFKHSRKIERRNSALAIIENGFKPTEYFYKDKFIYVVEEELNKIRILKTCYEKAVHNKCYHFPNETINP
jgi:hypothetical protein